MTKDKTGKDGDKIIKEQECADDCPGCCGVPSTDPTDKKDPVVDVK